MTTSDKKQATKIANKAIKQANQQAKETVQEKQELLKRMEESYLACETEGRDAFTNLRRLREQKLPRGDEIIIARRLYDELPTLKRNLRTKGMTLSEFCSRYNLADASESSKELHRLTLPPNKNPSDVRLRRGAGKYRLLLEAISKVSNLSVSHLADRVLLGTSLHPNKNIGNLNETEKIQTALQGIVNKIDREFSIFAKYMEVAEWKARHIANGGKENWPKWELDSDLDSAEQELADAMNPRYAFWNSKPNWLTSINKEDINKVIEENPLHQMILSHGESGARQDDNFFYVPHVALGMTDCFNLGKQKENPVIYARKVQHTFQLWRDVDATTGLSRLEKDLPITDRWDTESQKPVGQTSAFSSDFAWIVIYPMPDNSRLMPMLYMHLEEGGAYLAPLDVRNLDLFRDAIWFDNTRHMSVFDRIAELLGYRDGTEKVIEEGFRRTAPWLDHNPIFKLRQQHAEDLKLLDAFCQQLWEEK